MNSICNEDEFAASLDACVERLLVAAEVFAPPVDALVVARRLGMVVAMDDRQSGRARCVRFCADGEAEQAAIFVKPDARAERLQWSIAHEIGEHFAHEVFARLDIDPVAAPPQSRERVATAIGNRLLLPNVWFRSAAMLVDWDLPALKETFVTASHELIARRMIEFDVPAVMTIVDAGRVTWRRGTRGRTASPPSASEQLLLRRAFATGEKQSASDDDCEMRVWPIHEAGWKREIARTTPLERD